MGLTKRSLVRRFAPFGDKVFEDKTLKKRRWRLLQVEPSLACNLRCVMCPWREISKQTKDTGIMSQEVWEAIRPHLSQVKSIDFTGGGEPLLQPRLAAWIREAKAAGCETGFLTNGLLLEEGTAMQMIEAGLDWICISMDGATAQIYEAIRIGSNFEGVCRNVAHIGTLRAGKAPKTMINFVLMDLNIHQVEEIVGLAARLGVDQVNFKQCDVIRGEHGKGHGLFARAETKEVRRLKRDLAKARRLARKLKVQTTAFSFTPDERPVCEQDPRDSLFIRYDGLVAPCINLAYGGPTTFLGKEVTMPSVHYGHLPDEDLLALWERAPASFTGNGTGIVSRPTRTPSCTGSWAHHTTAGGPFGPQKGPCRRHLKGAGSATTSMISRESCGCAPLISRALPPVAYVWSRIDSVTSPSHPGR